MVSPELIGINPSRFLVVTMEFSPFNFNYAALISSQLTGDWHPQIATYPDQVFKAGETLPLLEEMPFSNDQGGNLNNVLVGGLTFKYLKLKS